MTKISRLPLKPYTKEDILREFWHSFGDLNTKDVSIFFKEVFTPTEILMIAKRLAILRALKEGIDYQSIRREYRVTDATISKMSNILHRASPEIFGILDRLIKAEKKRWKDFQEKRKKAGGVKGSRLIFTRKRRWPF